MDGDLRCFDGAYQAVTDVPEQFRVLYEERDGRVVLRPIASFATPDELAALAELKRIVDARVAGRGWRSNMSSGGHNRGWRR